jgi:DNA polymerase-3 subunit gamma/tau
VVFVLATTDPQKVLSTVKSRTQHLEFRLLSGETLHGLLADIRDAASLEVPDDALDAAVRRGHGSARDALSALDQVAASGDADDVRPPFDSLFDAIAAEQVTEVITALSTLLAAGWSAPQLATEACAELRQAFLLQLAPDVAETAGADRERLAALGESLGLARTVRALETLGRSMVEMRDAPDPTVVLEIALVRVTRPELDPSPAALLERLERLERDVATGGTARPGSDAPPQGRTRPPLGELRPTRLARGEPSRAPSPPTAPDRVAEPATEEPSPVIEAAPGAARAAAALDRDALTLAWGDAILPTLAPMARALFASGRFTAVEGSTCTFAVASEAPLDQYQRRRADVEAALAAHFATTVSLRLVVDDAPRAAPRTKSAPPAPDPASPPIEEIDLDDLDGGPVNATESVAAARVLDAFPGATEVPA